MKPLNQYEENILPFVSEKKDISQPKKRVWVNIDQTLSDRENVSLFRLVLKNKILRPVMVLCVLLMMLSFWQAQRSRYIVRAQINNYISEMLLGDYLVGMNSYYEGYNNSY